MKYKMRNKIDEMMSKGEDVLWMLRLKLMALCAQLNNTALIVSQHRHTLVSTRESLY